MEVKSETISNIVCLQTQPVQGQEKKQTCHSKFTIFKDSKAFSKIHVIYSLPIPHGFRTI